MVIQKWSEAMPDVAVRKFVCRSRRNPRRRPGRHGAGARAPSSPESQIRSPALCRGYQDFMDELKPLGLDMSRG